jgi:hypothetical protein
VKKNSLILLFLIVVPVLCWGQKSQINFGSDDAWETLLRDVKIKYAYSVKYNAMLPKPKFGDKLKALEGKIITLAGYSLPADLTGNVLLVSYNPMSMCFFCGGGGIESLVELLPVPEDKARFKRLNTDNYFEVKGRLRLNAKSYDHLVYILEDAEFVRMIKY